jgi:hypothetical protein
MGGFQVIQQGPQVALLDLSKEGLDGPGGEITWPSYSKKMKQVEPEVAGRESIVPSGVRLN